MLASTTLKCASEREGKGRKVEGLFWPPSSENEWAGYVSQYNSGECEREGGGGETEGEGGRGRCDPG